MVEKSAQQAYTPAPVPIPANNPELEQICYWADNEFRAIAERFNLHSVVQHSVLNVEPPKPREGTVAIADGTNWDPGGGAGLYVYRNGNWNLLVEEERGTFTPVFTCATVGDLARVYGSQTGVYSRYGRTVHWIIDIVVAITWTTASGQVTIEGLPWVMDQEYIAPLSFNGLTKAGGYTQFWLAGAPGSQAFAVEGGGSGVTISALTIANFPTGGTVVIRSSGHLQVQ